MNITEGSDFEDIKIFTDEYKEIASNSEINGNELVIKSEESLDYSTRYNILIPMTSIKTENGHMLKNDFLNKFQTTSLEPQVVFSNIFNNETDVSVDSNFSIQFNQDIVIDNISLLGLRVDGEEVESEKIVGDKWITIKPAKNLSSETEYELFIKNNAVKNSSFSLKKDFIINFKTEQLDPQSVKKQSSDTYYDIKRSINNNLLTSSVEMTKSEVMRSRVPYQDICQIDLSGEVGVDKVKVQIDKSAMNYLISREWKMQIVSNDLTVNIPVEALEGMKDNNYFELIIKKTSDALKEILVLNDKGNRIILENELDFVLKNNLDFDKGKLMIGNDGSLEDIKEVNVIEGNTVFKTAKIGYLAYVTNSITSDFVKFLDDYKLNEKVANNKGLVLEVGLDQKVELSKDMINYIRNQDESLILKSNLLTLNFNSKSLELGDSDFDHIGSSTVCWTPKS